MTQLTINLPREVTQDEAKLLLAAKLFETCKLSLGQAAQLSGYSKSTFIELLSKMGIPVINYPPEELDRKLSL